MSEPGAGKPSGRRGVSHSPAPGDLESYNAATAHLEPPFAVATVPTYRGEGKAFL